MSQFYRVAKTKRRQEVDLSHLPKNGKRIEWKKCLRHKVCYKYGEESGEFFISYKEKDRKHRGHILTVNHPRFSPSEISSRELMMVYIGKVVSDYNRYKYKLGEIVNNCEIIELVRLPQKGYEKGVKAYKVKCLETKEFFHIRESGLKAGNGSPYVAGHKFYYENSLMSREDLSRYIVNPEDSKLSLGSSKRILCKCIECGHKQRKVVHNLTRRGFYCVVCSKGVSLPERLLSSYLRAKNIEFEAQKVFPDLKNRRFDFFIPSLNMVVETHGEQHFSPSFGQKAFNNTRKSDKIKRDYLLGKHIKYLEINCSESSPEQIFKQLNNIDFLPSVNEEEFLKIKKDAFLQSKYPIKNMRLMYEDGYSIQDIATTYKLDWKTVQRLFKKSGYEKYTNRNKIVCINTMQSFENRSVAKTAFKQSDSFHSRVCIHLKGEVNYAGKHPTTGEPLKWMYYEDYVEKYGTEGLTEYVEDKRELL